MKKTILSTLVLLIGVTICIISCKKADYTFGKIITPGNLVVTTAIQGAGSSAPTGDGSGNITVTATATNALAYKIYFGNGDSVLTSTGVVNYKYTVLDTNTYTITVNAIGTGGASSTLSKQVSILYKFQIPDIIVADLTGGSSKNWAVAKDTTGHFGVGPSSTFTPDYYAATPDSRSSFTCSYNGIITFTKAGANTITAVDNNQGSSFLIGASTAFYGTSGGDGCYVINTSDVKSLGFSGANTGSNSSNSTGIQFSVPGNGIINYGTGATTYEILKITPTIIVLRDIGSDGNAWYQILRAQ